MVMKRLGAGIAILMLGARPLAAQDAAETALARETLAALQTLSFAKGREFCGFIGYDAQGVLQATRAVQGDEATCLAELPEDLAVTASYHTHGGFDPDYFGEIPSDIDVEGDAALWINGYVSTPGGRFWFVDTRAMEVRLLCGLSCLPMAPDYRKGANGLIASKYSYDALVRKLQGRN